MGAANRKPDFNAGRGRGKESPVSGPRASTTFAEELYTTKVPQNLSEEKRREAERIAAEIEEESKQKQLRGGRGDHHGPAPPNGAYGRGGGGRERSASGEYEDDDYADADAAEFVAEPSAAGPPAGAPPATDRSPAAMLGFAPPPPAALLGEPHHHGAGLPPPPQGAFGGPGPSTLPPARLTAAAAAQAQARAAAAAASAAQDGAADGSEEAPHVGPAADPSGFRIVPGTPAFAPVPGTPAFAPQYGMPLQQY